MLSKLKQHITALAIAIVAMTSVLLSQSNPIQLSLFTPVQIVDEKESIGGVRLNLFYGRNTAVKGLDLGLSIIRRPAFQKVCSTDSFH